MDSDAAAEQRHWSEIRKALKEFGYAESEAQGIISAAKDESEQAIRTKYISRGAVEATIGEDEDVSDRPPALDGAAWEDHMHREARNNYRLKLRRELGLGGEDVK